MQYTVTFSKDGYILVDANTPEEAIELAEVELKENGLNCEGSWYQIEVLDE